MYGLCGYPLWRCANVHMQALGCVYASWVLAVFFQVGGDEDQPEVGEEGAVVRLSMMKMSSIKSMKPAEEASSSVRSMSMTSLQTV